MKHIFITILGLMICASPARSQYTPVAEARRHEQAPAPPPTATNEPGNLLKTTAAAKSITAYSIGAPSDEEQLYVELMNRARANPPAEGIRLRDTQDGDVLSAFRFYSLDTNLLVSQFNAIAPLPPLSINAKLATAARLHSGDMFTNVYQGHPGSDGSSQADRATAQGYSFFALGENVYSSAYSVFYGHAGFNADWGTSATTGQSVGGMQSPPGHRENIHSPIFREIGVGVVDGVNTQTVITSTSTNVYTVGPQLVTQDFGTGPNATPFVTGVVYYDLNANGFYDPGEGIGGIRITAPGASFFAISADSGGYSIPVPSNSSYNVTFSDNGQVQNQRTAIVTTNNVKIDFIPAYFAPQVAGPNPAFAGETNNYTITPVLGATGYAWKRSLLTPFTLVEGAETGSSNVTLVTSASYNPIATDIKAAGSASFHLAHPRDPSNPTDQLLTLNRSLRVRTNSEIRFSSRLGWATPGQVATAQISTDGGTNWQTIWSQPGTGTSGETGFSRRTNSLAGFAGQVVQARFVYDHTGGSFFFQTDPGVGWYLDEISVSNAEELGNAVISQIASNSFGFVPGTGPYLFQAQAKVSNRYLPYGPALEVAVGPAPTRVRITRTVLLPGQQAQIDFQLLNGTASGFQIDSTPDLASTWSRDKAAVIQTVGAGLYRATTPLNGTQRFYRVTASP